MHGEAGAPRVTRGVGRLFVLLGLVIAAYLALSLLDHAARADGGLADHTGGIVPVASVKAVAGDVTKTAAEPKSVKPKSVKPKSVASKVRPQKTHRPATRRVHEAPTGRIGDSVRQARVRAGKLRQPTPTTVMAAPAAVERQKSPAFGRRPALPELTRLPDLPHVGLRVLPQLSLPAQVPGPPELPALVQSSALPHVQLSIVGQLPGPMQLTQTTSSAFPLLIASVAKRAYPLPQPVAFAPGSGHSGPIKPPEPARTAPLPASPQPPAERSTSTGQAGDAVSNASAMGTVSSSWRPETAAAGCRAAIDLIARGRTVRYAGPPS